MQGKHTVPELPNLPTRWSFICFMQYDLAWKSPNGSESLPLYCPMFWLEAITNSSANYLNIQMWGSNICQNINTYSTLVMYLWSDLQKQCMRTRTEGSNSRHKSQHKKATRVTLSCGVHLTITIHWVFPSEWGTGNHVRNRSNYWYIQLCNPKFTLEVLPCSLYSLALSRRLPALVERLWPSVNEGASGASNPCSWDHGK